MRISDWSSDVCSSDLDVLELRHAFFHSCDVLIPLNCPGFIIHKAVHIRRFSVSQASVPLQLCLELRLFVQRAHPECRDLDMLACRRSAERRVGKECPYV